MTIECANPYPGPEFFIRGDARPYFGRDPETTDLSSMSVTERLLVFYAPSGAGKTSLLNMRLIPRLEEKLYEVLPTARVSGAASLPANVRNVYTYNLMMRLAPDDPQPERFAELSLSDFLWHLSTADGKTYFYDPSDQALRLATSAHDLWPRVLILDQFEEIVTTYPAKWKHREDFFRQLDEALTSDQMLRVVLSLRSDYAQTLERYAGLLHHGLRARYQMPLMGIEDALRAIEGPAAACGRSFVPGVARRLVENMSQVRDVDAEGNVVTAPGEAVEPIQLQVVCYQLWESMKQAPGDRIEMADLWRLARESQAQRSTESPSGQEDENYLLSVFIDGALGAFFERALKEAMASAGAYVDEAFLRNWFSDKLITESGARGFLQRGEDETAGVPEAVVQELIDNHLLRSDTRGSIRLVELIHDRFVDPIIDANLLWNQQRRRAQPWIDAAYSWYESGDSPETRTGALLEGDALTTVLGQTQGHHLEPASEEYLAVSQAVQAKRDQEAALNTQRRRVLTLAALAGGVFLGLVILGILAFGWYGDNTELTKKTAELTTTTKELRETNSLLITKTQELSETNGLLVTKSISLTAAQRELESVTLSRIASRLNLQSEDQRQFALLLSMQAMKKSPTLAAESASIEALDAAYRHQAGWQPAVTPTLSFTQVVALPFSNPMAMTLRRDGEAVAAVVAGPAIVVALDPSAWVTRTVATSFARIDALALSDDGRLIAVAGCGQKPSQTSSDDQNPPPSTKSCNEWRIEVLPIADDSHFTRSVSLAQSASGVKALVFHPFLLQLVAATKDGSLLHWHLSASEPAAQQISARLSQLVDLSTSADGKYLSALDAQGRNQVWGWGVWDSLSEDWPSDLKANTYRSVAFVRDGKWFATGSDCPAGQDVNKSGDSCPALRLWEKNTQVPIGRPILVGAAIVDLGYDEQSRTLNLLQGQQLVRWDLNPQDWPELVCQRAGRTLTYDEWKEAFPNSKVEDYESACAHPLHNSFVQARIAEAEKKLDDCTPQGRHKGWDILDYQNIQRLPTAVTILVEEALGRFEENQPDLTNPAAACLEQANALLAAEGQATIPLELAMETARRLLDAEGKMASEPAIALGEFEVAKEQLAQWSVGLDSRLAKDYLTMCFEQGFLDACNTAQELSGGTLMTFGETKAGEILQGNEGTPWYFYAERGQAVTIAMDAVGDSFDTILYLDGSGGRIELTYDDDSGYDYNSLIKDFVVAEDGMYRIRPQALSGSGAYRLTLQQARTLSRIAVGEPAPATDSTESSWLYEGEAGQIVSLDMAIAGDGSDPYMALTRVSDASMVGEDYGLGRIDPRVLPADDLYRVTANLGSASGTFSVTLKLLQPLTLTVDQPEVSTTERNEMWAFEGTAGQIVNITLISSDPDQFDPEVDLRDSLGGVSTASSGDRTTARINSTILPKIGTYYVRTGPGRNSTPYTLTVSTGIPLTLTVDQTVLSSTDGDTLWNLNATPGQIVQINLAEEGSGLDTILRLFDGDGQQIGYDDDGGAGYNSLLTLVLPDSPSYLVQADRYDGSGAFSLAVAELEPEPLPVDGSSATILPDRAWRVDGQAGQVLTIDIVDTRADGAGSLQLVTSDGAVLASSEGGSQLAAILPQNGEYLLLPQNVADSGEDTLTARLTDAASASNLDGVASQTLTQLALNNAIDQALALYAWGTTGRNVAFTADARNALCRFGALRGEAARVIDICETLLADPQTTDPWVLSDYHDSRGLARALAGNAEDAAVDFEFYAANDGYYPEQRREWARRLLAGNPVTDVFDEATLRDLLQR